MDLPCHQHRGRQVSADLRVGKKPPDLERERTDVGTAVDDAMRMKALITHPAQAFVGRVEAIEGT